MCLSADADVENAHGLSKQLKLHMQVELADDIALQVMTCR